MDLKILLEQVPLLASAGYQRLKKEVSQKLHIRSLLAPIKKLQKNSQGTCGIRVKKYQGNLHLFNIQGQNYSREESISGEYGYGIKMTSQLHGVRLPASLQAYLTEVIGATQN